MIAETSRSAPTRPLRPLLGHKGTGIMDAEHQETTTLQLVLAWGFVGIPLVFGVVQTLINSMKLFQ
jgi:hypothetical protein